MSYHIGHVEKTNDRDYEVEERFESGFILRIIDSSVHSVCVWRVARPTGGLHHPGRILPSSQSKERRSMPRHIQKSRWSRPKCRTGFTINFQRHRPGVHPEETLRAIAGRCVGGICRET
jgi:hypothetical protein